MAPATEQQEHALPHFGLEHHLNSKPIFCTVHYLRVALAHPDFIDGGICADVGVWVLAVAQRG